MYIHAHRFWIFLVVCLAIVGQCECFMEANPLGSSGTRIYTSSRTAQTLDEDVAIAHMFAPRILDPEDSPEYSPGSSSRLSQRRPLGQYQPYF